LLIGFVSIDNSISRAYDEDSLDGQSSEKGVGNNEENYE